MKNYRSAFAFAAFILMVGPLNLHAADPKPSADALYQEAVFQETTTRDLDGAIQLYQKTLQQPDVSRTLQSNAYLRMGICHRTLGHNEQAKEAWDKVIQNYADQPSVYQEARAHLQELAVESGKAAQVQPSTPTVQVIYAIPKTRWELQLFRIRYIPSSDTANFDLPSLAYFYKPNRALGLVVDFWSEMVTSDGNSISKTSPLDIASIAMTHLWEKPIGNQFRPYVKIGPSAYGFWVDTTEGTVSKWSPGMMTEAGATIGWSRGFIFTLGYALNVFYQPSLDGVKGSSIRGVHGARFALGYRW